MTAFERGCRLRIASKSLAVVLSATLTARYPGSANWATGPKDGQFADKQARLEAEYSNLDCARSAR